MEYTWTPGTGAGAPKRTYEDHKDTELVSETNSRRPSATKRARNKIQISEEMKPTGSLTPPRSPSDRELGRGPQPQMQPLGVLTPTVPDPVHASAPTNGLGVSVEPAPANVAGEANYGTFTFARNNTSIRPFHEESPGDIAQLVNQMRQDCNSTDPIQDLKVFTEALNAVKSSYGKKDVGYRCNAVFFPGRTSLQGTGLRRDDYDPMPDHALRDFGPQVDTEHPVPAMLYGYDHLEAFPLEQFPAELYPRSGLRVIYPFLVIHFLGDGSKEGGSRWEATNECLGASAKCVSFIEEANAEMYAYNNSHDRPTQPIQPAPTAAFSIVISGTEARLFVSWKHNGKLQYARKVNSFLLHDPPDHKQFRTYVRNILDWGRNERLMRIRNVLDCSLQIEKLKYWRSLGEEHARIVMAARRAAIAADGLSPYIHGLSPRQLNPPQNPHPHPAGNQSNGSRPKREIIPKVKSEFPDDEVVLPAAGKDDAIALPLQLVERGIENHAPASLPAGYAFPPAVVNNVQQAGNYPNAKQQRGFQLQVSQALESNIQYPGNPMRPQVVHLANAQNQPNMQPQAPIFNPIGYPPLPAHVFQPGGNHPNTQQQRCMPPQTQLQPQVVPSNPQQPFVMPPVTYPVNPQYQLNVPLQQQPVHLNRQVPGNRMMQQLVHPANMQPPQSHMYPQPNMHPQARNTNPPCYLSANGYTLNVFLDGTRDLSHLQVQLQLPCGLGNENGNWNGAVAGAGGIGGGGIGGVPLVHPNPHPQTQAQVHARAPAQLQPQPQSRPRSQ